MKIKAAIFDTDEVLLRREEFFSRRLSREYNVPLENILQFFDNEFQLCTIGRADLREELKKYMTKWSWKKSVEELMEYWFSGENKPELLDKDLMEQITRFRKRGIKVIVVTNNEKYRTADIIKKLNLLDKFDHVISSAHVGFRKADKEFWQYVLNKINIRPEEVYYWDDCLNDVKVASQMGIQAFVYTNFQNFKKDIVRKDYKL